MSQAETETPHFSRKSYLVLLIVGGAVLMLVLLAWLILKPGHKRRDQRTDLTIADEALAQARLALSRDADLAICRSALQQLNNYLGLKPPAPGKLRPLPADELSRLLDLDEDALGELRSERFSFLDGQHLDQCFLLRDVALTLQASGLPVKPTPLEKAATAFAWTMSQVRPDERERLLVPPAFALRRGWGSGLERGLVFLALLQQVGPPEELQGCLVYCPETKDGPVRFWACGVIVEGGQDVYLFDPRLGLPLPGPQGKGVATLKQVSTDPAVLAQLSTKETTTYDIKPEQASAAELQLVCSLSALSPRMRYLQETLLGPSIRVHLTSDPLKEHKRLKKTELRVVAWREPVPRGNSLAGAGLLRRFLPPEEGGIDKPAEKLHGRFMGYQYGRPFGLVPWEQMPSAFLDESLFPQGVDMGLRVQLGFAKPFRDSVMVAQLPRNLILRGRFSKAYTDLTKEKEDIRYLLEAVDQPETQKELVKGAEGEIQVLRDLYALQQGALLARNSAGVEKADKEIKAAWEKTIWLPQLMRAAAALPRKAEVMYLQAQCSTNEAEQLQTQRELLHRAGLEVQPAELQKAEVAWKKALNDWRLYLEEFPEGAVSVWARLRRARVLSALGQKEEAAKEWEDAPAKGLTRVAALYLAQSARKK